MKILLIVGAIAAVMSLLAEASSLAFPLTDDQEFADNPLGAAVTLIIFLLGVLEFFIYLATVVFFLMWLYRAYNNLRAFNSWARLDYSSGWAVGSFFIPFVNLVVPYRAVKEVWEKSAPADDVLLSEPGVPSVFPIWWLFWILSSIAGNISVRVSFDEKVPESTVTIISIVASGLSVIAALFAYLVVDAIDKRQEEARGKLRLGRPSGPPPPPSNLSMLGVVAPLTSPNNSQQS